MKVKEENLIFIVSLPRSGSTFLQSLVSNNAKTNTNSEFWPLLKFSNGYKPELFTSIFDNKMADKAFDSYLSSYPQFDFSNIQKNFLLEIYKPLFHGYEFVVDKAPRYYEILDEISSIFPKSKIILLKRNPIDVVKSMIATWDLSSIKELTYFKRDLIFAPKCINAFHLKNLNNPNVYSLRYEDLVEYQERETRKIYDWLGLHFNSSVLQAQKNNKFKGDFGDPFLNSKKTYFEAQQQAHNRNLSRKHSSFIKGYYDFLGKDFLHNYGAYTDEKIDARSTLAFKYFYFLTSVEEDPRSVHFSLVYCFKYFFLKIFH